MSEVEDGIDNHFLTLIEEAEADAIAAGGIIKRPKLSDSTTGDGRRPENQEEGSYMAALRGSRSSLWQRHQNDLNILKNDSGGSGFGSRSSTSAPSSTIAAGACFKCGMTGHWARECGGAEAGSADRADGFAPAKQCPCGSGTCLVLTSNTAKNPGRMFYRCPLKVENGGCKYFEWCDSPSSGITMDSQSISEVPVLHCPCGAGACLILVSKSGKNEGQQYYKCPGNEGRGPCGFFKWCSEQGSVSRQSSFSQQFHGSSSVSKSQFSADQTNSSCFKCGQGGHWAKDCQIQPSNSSLVGGISQPSFAGTATGTCFKCGQEGHWARDCQIQRSNSSLVGGMSQPSFAGSATGTCFKCGQEGHWAKECQNQTSNSLLFGGISQPSFAGSGSGSGSTSGTCFKCGKSGHWARDCPAQSSYSSSSAAAAAAHGKRNFGSSQSSH